MILLIALLHGIPVFLAGAIFKNFFWVIFTAIFMAIIAVAAGNPAYMIADLALIALGTYFGFQFCSQNQQSERDLVWVEPGDFVMGAADRPVSLNRGYYIGKTPVTWGDWQIIRSWGAANLYDIGSVGAGCSDNHPVQSVNWFDVLKWCNAKSELENLTPVYTINGAIYRSGEPEHSSISQNLSANGYRLPLETEWEFAARGGNKTNIYIFAGSNNLNDVGWYENNSVGAPCNLGGNRGTWPVRQKAPNELGLYDMSGNVYEWCWDEAEAPWPSWRSYRGGSWGSKPRECTVWARDSYLPNARGHLCGFRLARSKKTVHKK